MIMANCSADAMLQFGGQHQDIRDTEVGWDRRRRRGWNGARRRGRLSACWLRLRAVLRTYRWQYDDAEEVRNKENAAAARRGGGGGGGGGGEEW